MKKKLLSGFMGLVPSLVVLEVALRIYNPLGFSVKGDNIVLAKNQTTRVVNHDIPTLDKDIVIKRNKLGFRGDNPPRSLSEYTSIIAVGESTTACFYVTEGKTWPDTSCCTARSTSSGWGNCRCLRPTRSRQWRASRRPCDPMSIGCAS